MENPYSHRGREEHHAVEKTPTARSAADGRGILEMSETTVRQSVASTREQIWLNREQVRKGKTVYRALKRAQDIFSVSYTHLTLPTMSCV